MYQIIRLVNSFGIGAIVDIPDFKMLPKLIVREGNIFELTSEQFEHEPLNTDRTQLIPIYKEASSCWKIHE